jgi:hypothetical protein
MDLITNLSPVYTANIACNPIRKQCYNNCMFQKDVLNYVSKLKIGSRYIFSFLFFRMNLRRHKNPLIVRTLPPTQRGYFSPCERSESEAPHATPPVEPSRACRVGSLVAFSPATGVFTRDLRAELFKGSLPPLKEGQGPFIIELLFHSGARPLSIIQWQYRTWRGVNTSFANAERRWWWWWWW